MYYDPCAIEIEEELGMDLEDFGDSFAEDPAIVFNPRTQYNIGSSDAFGDYMHIFSCYLSTILMWIDQKCHPHLPRSLE